MPSQREENFTRKLNFHPLKIVTVQELSDGDMANRSTVAEHLIGILSDDVIILMADKGHFHSSGCVHKQNCSY
jgi:hypothetical protein